MKGRPAGEAGEFPYLSERKLINLAVHYGVKTGALGPDVGVEAGASVSAGAAPIGEVSAHGSVRTDHVDPGKRERVLARQLEQVLARLGDLPLLEDSPDLREGQWFRFHRRLRFGVGQSDDSAPTVTALVIVDHEPVPEGPLIPGLLMNGSVAHVRPPYTTEDLRNARGSRSGSGTGRLFIWLEELRQALEASPGSELSEVEARILDGRPPPRGRQTALDMYRLFAGDGWMDSSLVPRLLDGAPCEGVAQASLIAVGEEETALVMASPLFLRVCQLPDPPEQGSEKEKEAPGWMARLLGPG